MVILQGITELKEGKAKQWIYRHMDWNQLYRKIMVLIIWGLKHGKLKYMTARLQKKKHIYIYIQKKKQMEIRKI